ncbi:MAG: 1-acyl-sn-glycerol-3-phosphate acyltransferase [Melioribacteraceae bacterium]|nr:1-acyl-sn-glycerol-3-phosphate acyltransferase [Melioribacteraceae bacterium]MCF8355081.1 1-acyl-sn-glycerol-3-phosphate acyltransferase [Melioribacteraceae bacterium]MCF8394650.1 1-acyl-sn-glycerol-3-phosphate acyltransferase [Melioribacteraceae bacterium]MCF8420299.1 1-acyl-sn-glycerol-3-phosphate acyltransferase [Melioribacteraceae bacterium]
MFGQDTSYHKILPNNDEYITSNSVPRRSPHIATSIFYPNMLRIFIYSNIKARRGIYDDYNWVNSSLDVIGSLEKAGVKIHVKGMKQLEKFDGPAVFIGNHMSTLETFALPSLINPVKRVIFVIKKELATYPLFGRVATARDPIVVGRKNPREDLQIVFNEGAEYLKKGRSIIIFPSRTRSSKFQSSTFNSLGIKLAQKNNVHVVPIALVTDAWSNGKRIKDFGKIYTKKDVHFEFGEPMLIEGNSSEYHLKTVDFIKQKLISWGREDLIID